MQKEVAEKVGVSLSNLNRMEKEVAVVTRDVVERVADLTNYPVSFFYQRGEAAPEAISYRKRQVVAAKILTPIAARTNIIRNHIERLMAELQIALPTPPVLPVAADATPQDVALKLRKRWRVADAVIPNLTAVMEEHGIVITAFDFNTARVDSRSMFTEGGQPVVFYNQALTGDRQRFTLAYELGHLVMHASTEVDASRDVSHEANLFAAALLMPEKEIKKDFEGGITVPKLADLKKKWKVSMIALLHRADDLGFISPNQKKYILHQFNAMQIRRREPVELDVPAERPQLLRRWLAQLKATKKLKAVQVAELLHLKLNEFVELYS